LFGQVWVQEAKPGRVFEITERICLNGVCPAPDQSHDISMPTEAEKLRAQAARLFTMAIDARDKGDHDIAEAFTARAAQYLEAASDAESKAGTAPPAAPPSNSTTPQQHVAQQQQQVQPEKKEDP
jgi:hypothetical protein